MITVLIKNDTLSKHMVYVLQIEFGDKFIVVKPKSIIKFSNNHWVITDFN